MYVYRLVKLTCCNTIGLKCYNFIFLYVLLSEISIYSHYLSKKKTPKLKITIICIKEVIYAY